MNARTFGGMKMYGPRLWLSAVIFQALLLSAHSAKSPLRRSLGSHQALPVTKGGWRPVVGSSNLMFNFGTAPLHSPYKYPLPVLDYPSSARPLAARDATKLTSIAQSYRPTTHRSVSLSSPAASQPINSYLNPFALPSNNQAHYKYVQNFPFESVVIRNPHNPYAARPVFTKQYAPKQQYQLKPQYIQQLGNIQPIQFPIQTVKPTNNNIYAKPVNEYIKPVHEYAKPTDSKSSGNTEIYKTEVYKLPDDSSQQGSQQGTQQVKTAQQQQAITPKIPVSPFPQYATYQDAVLPQNFLGSFGSFGVQNVKARDPIFPPPKTTYYPVPTTKQTLFNSFSFAPFKTTPTFLSTTPKLQTTANQIHYGTNWNEFKTVVTQAPKVVTPAKIDPNSNKGAQTFKPSPQDPFIKDYKVSTYNPLNTVQPTTFSYSNYHDYNPQQQKPQQQSSQHQKQQQHNSNSQQQHVQTQNYYNTNNHQEVGSEYKKKHKIHAHDSAVAGGNEETAQQYASPPTKAADTQTSAPHRATYEVSEAYDEATKSPPESWPVTSELYNVKDEVVTKSEYEYYSRPATTLPEIPEEVSIVTEGDKGYDNSLGYDGQVESQSRRPLGDDFEPIGKHKLKDYYYRVSTPAYEGHSGRRTKKPTESSKYSVHEVTTYSSNQENNDADVLPTLPPNKHFKRPSVSSPTPEPAEKDKTRKRTKIRRRRPPVRNGDHSSTRKYPSSTEATHTTEETHTINHRVRPTASKPSLTTPTASAVDLTTSALPTITPTVPSIVKKKLINRRPYTTTTTEKPEPTTTPETKETNKESSIMKISASSRNQYPRVTPTIYERTSETPDYTHKQDEKDTPTSDIIINADTLKTEPTKGFSFHRDAKPVEAKLEPIIREVFTTEGPKESESNEVTTTTRAETTTSTNKLLRPRLKNKFGRPGFSVKDYRNRLSSTTTTEKSVDNPTPKIRFPNRRQPTVTEKTENDNGTERKKFTPKEPRHKLNATEISDELEKEIHTLRPNRHRHNNAETTEISTTTKISARIRNGQRRPRPTEEPETTTEAARKRPLRKKIKDNENAESVQDITVTEVAEHKDITSERTRSESAIMKIADKKHQDHNLDHLFEHSKRVSDLTLAASKDYNTPGKFKTVSSNSRRIPSYFTIATDDPILPIEAFFPQINQKKEA